MRAPTASHQCVPIPKSSVICGLSLLLVLYSALRGFSLGTPVFPSPQKPTFPNSNSILEYTDISERVLVTPWCYVGKQITYLNTLILNEIVKVLLRPYTSEN